MENIELELIALHSGLDFDYRYFKNNNHIHIDRFFIYEEYRQKGIATSIMKNIIKFADINGIILTALIMPDDESDECYEIIRNFFAKFGFEPDVIDGETYRNDITRLPIDITELSKQTQAITIALQRDIETPFI